MAQYKKEINVMLFRVVEQSLNQGAIRKKTVGSIGFDELLILEHIHQHGGQPLSKVMNALNFERRSFQSIVHKLIKSKWVEKYPVDEDKRRVVLELTEKGAEMLLTEKKQLERGLDYLIKDLTVNEEKGVLKFLSKLHQYIKS